MATCCPRKRALAALRTCYLLLYFHQASPSRSQNKTFVVIPVCSTHIPCSLDSSPVLMTPWCLNECNHTLCSLRSPLSFSSAVIPVLYIASLTLDTSDVIWMLLFCYNWIHFNKLSFRIGMLFCVDRGWSSVFWERWAWANRLILVNLLSPPPSNACMCVVNLRSICLSLASLGCDDPL